MANLVIISALIIPLLLLLVIVNQANAQQTKPYGNPVFLDKMQHLFAPYLSNSFIDAESGCDGTVTDALVSHSIGNNATINHLANLYLNVRGIR